MTQRVKSVREPSLPSPLRHKRLCASAFICLRKSFSHIPVSSQYCQQLLCTSHQRTSRHLLNHSIGEIEALFERLPLT